jgi:ABC-type sugar transport system ATPase subunit
LLKKKMTTVTLSHISKRFLQDTAVGQRDVLAVDDLSLKIPSGEVLAVLGPSGCGKSTLLRIVAGLTLPDRGDVFYDHENLRDIPSEKRGVGMVFQEGALIPHWIAERNIGFFLFLRHRENELPERVARISEITGFGLETLLERRPGQLSGGERQRVAVARALARDPRVFLFDEPFSNIDAKLRAHARFELKRLLKEFPVTSVYVTHDQVEAVALAHRVAVMRAGKIEQVDTYHALYYNPVNLFVATFIGTPTINLFEGTSEATHWQGKSFGGFRIRGDLPEHDKVILGVRPESIWLKPEGVPCIVVSVMPHFSERFHLVEVENGNEQWHLTVPLETVIQRGETLYCALDPDALLYFDAKTGRRIG